MYGTKLPDKATIHEENKHLIPYNILTNDKRMNKIREMFELNISMPGAIELVHPNRFVPNLRPVEDFRHTPLVPISDR